MSGFYELWVMSYGFVGLWFGVSGFWFGVIENE